ncbi:MAG: hypothetical protein ACJ749_19325 [Flavisolibacter sp.]
MKSSLPKLILFVLLFAACNTSRNSSQSSNESVVNSEASPEIAPDMQAQSLTDLPQSQFGGFILKPGFYEAEFKTYCLQPGTPDPRQGDAYLQGPITGYRKDIVQSILLNSRDNQEIDQRNIQLLLWSVVSGSDFTNLSYSVQTDAAKLLTPKQIFELKGGVMGVIKNVSYSSGLMNANNDIRRLFETSINSYEAYEKIAVQREQSKIIKKGVKYDQWYKQKENYYVRYFPESYKKVKIQVYVPNGILDADNKLNDEFVVFDPTGQQAIPAFTNAQRLGIGSTVVDVVRAIIKIDKRAAPVKKIPKKTDNPKSAT